MSVLKRAIACVWLLLITLSPVGATAQAPLGPEELVKDTSEKMLATLKADREEINAHPERLYELVADIVLPHFDFERMARWVLGKYWRRATPEQQAAFTREFRTLLVRTYGTALFDYNDQTISYLPVRLAENADKVSVKTEVEQAGGPSIPIGYSLFLANGEWKVYDVTVDGVSLVTNYRSSFAATIKSSGIAELIDDLVARNKQAAQPTASTP